MAICSRVICTAVAVVQGPALYVYNDAVFTDEDWKGIRLLQESIKENDPMKVGRFGLGFKSVFHMTGYKVQLLIVDRKRKVTLTSL